VSQMVLYSSPGTHPGSGNDNAGALDVVYGLGLGGASHRFQVKKEESRIGSHSPLFTMSWGRKDQSFDYLI